MLERCMTTEQLTRMTLMRVLLFVDNDQEKTLRSSRFMSYDSPSITKPRRLLCHERHSLLRAAAPNTSQQAGGGARTHGGIAVVSLTHNWPVWSWVDEWDSGMCAG